MIVSEEQRIRVVEGPWSPVSVARQIVDGGAQEDPFYVMDVGEVVARYHAWKELMPRVEPFYAVKCNDDKLLVTTLAALGAGFDCASRAEIELVTSIGVSPQRIIFANPAKMASHIKYSSRAGVDTMTFDSETELIKIKQHMPHAQLVIRIRCDASEAQCPLGIKFGCDPVSEAPRLLKLAAVLGLEVMGVSFHVGSGARETGVYVRAIQYARALFALAAGVGHSNMRLLDIGGGFPGSTHSDLREVAGVINGALETYFSGRGVRVIAEPGRYFAAAAYTLCAMVHAKREVCQKDEEGNERVHTMYFINDGVYGSFNCILYDHQTVAAETLEPKSEKPQECSVWGPSCDGLDCVLESTSLPPLGVGEWLVFRDMGAYTIPVASAFNGFPVPKVRALIDSTLCPLDCVLESTTLPPLGVGEWLVFRDMGAYTIPVASAFNGFPVPKVRALIDSTLWSSLKNCWPLNESHFCIGERITGPHEVEDEPLPPSPESSPGASPVPSAGPVFVECALK